MFYISKIFSFLLNPLIWIFLGLLLIVRMKNKKRRKWVIACWCIMSYVLTNSVLFHEAAMRYETPYVPIPEGRVYDYAIVLGGASSFDSFSRSLQLNQSAERVVEPVILYRKGVVRKLLFSGGSANVLPPYIKEAVYIRRFWKSLGVPDSAILLETESRNTLENAAFSANMIRARNPQARILLITSALHMPRSRKIFEKTGLNVDIYPVDFLIRRGRERKINPADFILPRTSSLIGWEALIHEIVGLLVAGV